MATEQEKKDQQPIRIVIFKNSKKTDPSQPDYNGKIVQGETVLNYVALWAEKSKTGMIYLSGAVNPPSTVSPDEMPL